MHSSTPSGQLEDRPGRTHRRCVGAAGAGYRRCPANSSPTVGSARSSPHVGDFAASTPDCRGSRRAADQPSCDRDSRAGRGLSVSTRARGAVPVRTASCRHPASAGVCRPLLAPRGRAEMSVEEGQAGAFDARSGDRWAAARPQALGRSAGLCPSGETPDGPPPFLRNQYGGCWTWGSPSPPRSQAPRRSRARDTHRDGADGGSGGIRWSLRRARRSPQPTRRGRSSAWPRCRRRPPAPVPAQRPRLDAVPGPARRSLVPECLAGFSRHSR